MKALIIGADGQLGFDLVRTFGPEAIGLTHKDIEVTDPASVAAILEKYRPTAVLNTAAIVKPEWCDQNRQVCMNVNAQGQANVAAACAKIGAIPVFFSSDYVFDGSKKSFTEEDEVNALNVYGETKVAGEKATQQATPSHYIIRTSWLFGVQMPHKGSDFPRAILKQADEGKPIKVIADRFGSPTYTRDLAQIVAQLIRDKAAYGTYHVTNSGSCSWYELAVEVLRQCSSSASVTPQTTAESGTTIQHPSYSVLENAKLRTLGIVMRPWQEALTEYLKEIGRI
jgi:dTDP-4-dehydrorhamnose reductase